MVPRLVGGGPVQVGAVPADLNDFRLGILDETQVAGVLIADQVIEQAREFDAARRLGMCNGDEEEHAGERGGPSHGWPFQVLHSPLIAFASAAFTSGTTVSLIDR